MADSNTSSPLEYGKLAPAFSLEATDGQTYTRSQFRNRSGLVLIFFQPSPDAISLLKLMESDQAEYKELNSRVLAIGHAPVQELKELHSELASPYTILADPDGDTWKAYSGCEDECDAIGYGVVILDLYGGVDAQKFVTLAKDLPDHSKILEWARAAQYKCSI